MAKATKKTTEDEPKKKRNRRTADQIVADLEARIAHVKARAAAKEAKQDPAAKALISAVKAVEKSLAIATEHKAAEIAKALEASMAPLSVVLIERGMRLPDPGKKRGRKPAAA